MIIHIGLGKTGTTSLQKYVFPKLVELGCLALFNPPEVMLGLRRYVATGKITYQLIEQLQEYPKNTLISLESLVGWNPAIWREFAKANREVFGREATIIITVREPESYLASLYVQMLHQGLVVSPQSFYLNEERYNFVAPMARERLCEIFNVDRMNFAQLETMYAESFDKVHIVPLSRLADLEFVSELVKIDATALEKLRKGFASTKRENRAFSQRAVRLTLWREKVLSKLRLRSKSSHDDFLEHYSSEVHPGLQPVEAALKSQRRVGRFKIFRRVMSSFFQWRTLMQNGLDRLLPYSKYQLPRNVPRGEYFEQNQLYYKSLSECGSGYRTVGSKVSNESERKATD